MTGNLLADAIITLAIAGTWILLADGLLERYQHTPPVRLLIACFLAIRNTIARLPGMRRLDEHAAPRRKAQPMTITEFLLARITEDEAEANAADAVPAPWGFWDDTRVLAECQAKRAIVEAHEITTNVYAVNTNQAYGYACTLCFGDGPGEPAEGLGACDTLTALTAVYADHPDYRGEWRP